MRRLGVNFNITIRQIPHPGSNPQTYGSSSVSEGGREPAACFEQQFRDDASSVAWPDLVFERINDCIQCRAINQPLFYQQGFK